jgi:hypothetical protein
MSDDREQIMREWDTWRAYIARGGGGSWPRDAFEGLIDGFAATIEGLTKERDEAIKLRNEWHKNWQDAESELAKAQQERDEARRQRDLAEIMRSGTERMVMADRDAIAAELAKAREALAFVAKMAWRTDPPNVVNNLTDEERLSAIKWHPTIREVSKPHRELAEREAAALPPKPEEPQSATSRLGKEVVLMPVSKRRA